MVRTPAFRWFWWWAVFTAQWLQGHPHDIAPCPPGYVETGRPLFLTKSRESLGLTSNPSDLQVLPDGRLLVVAGRQLLLGDGVRWELFNQADDDASLISSTVVIQHDGQIFAGVTGGFARVDFDDRGRWRLRVVERWQGDDSGRHPVLSPVELSNKVWLWHSKNGPIVHWVPGQSPVLMGRANTVGTVFSLGQESFLCDRTDGSIVRLGAAGSEMVEPGRDLEAGFTMECGVSLSNGLWLGSTLSQGMVLFDGKKRVPFAPGSNWTRTVRASALCQTEGGFFAAATMDQGILFFDSEGVVRQVLPRTADFMLSRVRKLIAQPGGVVWGLVDTGLVAIAFPSSVSYFEPFVNELLSFAMPFRVAGKLWLEVDGSLLRGEYSPEGILVGFVTDRPSIDYTFSISEWEDSVLASTSKGLFLRGPFGWLNVDCPYANLRVIDANPANQRWLFAATGAVGWMRKENGKLRFEGYAAPSLRYVHDALKDQSGRIWLETGEGSLSCVELMGGIPSVRTFSDEQGVPPGWAQVFAIGNSVRFNMGDDIYLFDESTGKMQPDTAFSAQFQGVNRLIGRASLDARGNIWFADEMGTAYWVPSAEGLRRQGLGLTRDIAPFSYTTQRDGVVWMQGNGRLLRYDPNMPTARPAPMQTLITHVELTGTGQVIFPQRQSELLLPHSQSTVALHFAAPGSSPFEPATFEVRSNRSEQGWTSSGHAGFTVFNQLEPDRYSVEVRARTAESLAVPATFGFTVMPPWYRTPLAYLAYFVLFLTGVALIAWAASFLQRRENLRLEQLVRQRTSELKESNQQLEQQFEENRRLSLAIAQSPVGVAIIKTDGTIVFANPRFSELYGYTLRDIIGHSVSELRLQPFVPELSPVVKRVLDSGESWHGQLTNQAKDGHPVHVRSAIAPIRGPDGPIRHYLILQEDISEWLAEQDRRHRLESQLLQAQKLDALGTLAGGIAHDFNNILTGILGYCELAKLDAEEPHQVCAALEEIKSAGLRAKDLVARILTFSRQSTPSLAPMDLAGAVADAHKLLRASTPSTVEYVLHLHPGIIMGDSTQIHQVVVNLCTNAVHAMKDRPGRILVEVKSVQLGAEEAADISDLAAGKYIRLTVSDTGMGMDAKTLERIFDPFFTTKQPGEGTGLGLAIVRGIVANHRGGLRVKSQISAGTSFEIYFPTTERTPTFSPFGTTTGEGGSGQVLVVDDEEMIANFIANRLRRLGYQPLVFTQPQLALAAYRRNPKEFQAMVSDLTMPGMTGLQLLSSIREDDRLLPAVIVSGYGAQFMGIDPSSLPKCLLLPKPFHGDELARALAQVLARS